MTGFNIIMVIAVILFARLGVRLFFKWKEIKNSTPDQDSSEGEKNLKSKSNQLNE